jgi:protein TonB
MAIPDFSGLQMSALSAPSDRSATPLVQVPPMYPQRAQSRGIEGWVLIEFDISPAGQVLNPRVIDADPAGIFDRAALRAIERWKYKPQIVDGKPVPQYNKEQLISFKIEQ